MRLFRDFEDAVLETVELHVTPNGHAEALGHALRREIGVRLGQLPASADEYARAVAIREKIGDDKGLAKTLRNLAIVQAEQGMRGSIPLEGLVNAVPAQLRERGLDIADCPAQQHGVWLLQYLGRTVNVRLNRAATAGFMPADVRFLDFVQPKVIIQGEITAKNPGFRGVQRRAFLSDPTHKHVFHFTPKHGSWLNQVEIWFSILEGKSCTVPPSTLSPSFASTTMLFIEVYNENAKPFVWTKAKVHQRRVKDRRISEL